MLLSVKFVGMADEAENNGPMVLLPISVGLLFGIMTCLGDVLVPGNLDFDGTLKAHANIK